MTAAADGDTPVSGQGASDTNQSDAADAGADAVHIESPWLAGVSLCGESRGFNFVMLTDPRPDGNAEGCWTCLYAADWLDANIRAGVSDRSALIERLNESADDDRALKKDAALLREAAAALAAPDDETLAKHRDHAYEVGFSSGYEAAMKADAEGVDSENVASAAPPAAPPNENVAAIRNALPPRQTNPEPDVFAPPAQLRANRAHAALDALAAERDRLAAALADAQQALALIADAEGTRRGEWPTQDWACGIARAALAGSSDERPEQSARQEPSGAGVVAALVAGDVSARLRAALEEYSFIGAPDGFKVLLREAADALDALTEQHAQAERDYEIRLNKVLHAAEQRLAQAEQRDEWLAKQLDGLADDLEGLYVSDYVPKAVVRRLLGDVQDARNSLARAALVSSPPTPPPGVPVSTGNSAERSDGGGGGTQGDTASGGGV